VTCSIPDCDRPVKCRALCAGHYSRLLRKGTTGSAELWDRQRKPCVIDGCDRLARAYSLCTGHRSRAGRGDLRPDVPLGVRAPLTYSGVHQLVSRTLGPASDHLCIDCLGPANEWAYDGADPDEVVHEGRRFSRDVQHYMPMCIPCHRRFDQTNRDAA
jgi:hypothetical protein